MHPPTAISERSMLAPQMMSSTPIFENSNLPSASYGYESTGSSGGFGYNSSSDQELGLIHHAPHIERRSDELLMQKAAYIRQTTMGARRDSSTTGTRTTGGTTNTSSCVSSPKGGYTSSHAAIAPKVNNYMNTTGNGAGPFNYQPHQMTIDSNKPPLSPFIKLAGTNP